VTTLEVRAKQFWSAALFIRRARDRDPAIAIHVLNDVAAHAAEAIQYRAAALLKEIENGKRSRTYEG
jgi:hypothetical protein